MGLFLTLGSVPNAPGRLVPYLVLVGGALTFVWLGGVLMGRASGARPTAPRAR